MRKDKKARKPNIRPKNVGGLTQADAKLDYKEILTLKRFTSDRGKILPQKYSGLSAKNQRLLAQEIKKARYMALLPYTDKHAL